MKALWLTLFCTSFAWAEISQVNIQDFDFNYSAPVGEGIAQSFSYQEDPAFSEQKVSVEKVGEEFKIYLEGTENGELVFKDAPDLIQDATEINLSDFNLVFDSSLGLSFSSVSFTSPEDVMKAKQLKLSCARSSQGQNIMDQTILGCTQKMSFKASSVSSQGSKREFSLSKALQTLAKVADESHDELRANVQVKNFDLKVSNGKFELAAEIKAQISGKAKGKGTMSYNPANKKMTIKISEFKFGILNVTSQVFDQLKKQESETLKVNEPYVYLTIK